VRPSILLVDELAHSNLAAVSLRHDTALAGVETLDPIA
jgi:K+-sensing histidine kinase KdpD